MKIRFLQTTASGRPGYPFVAGQVIDVSEPTADMLACLKAGADGPSAEVVDEEAPEAAVLAGTAEQAVRPRAVRRARAAAVSDE